jgi:SAM-dependent methyltransferase
MSVFNSLYAEHYDQLYAEKNYDSECDLIEAALKLSINDGIRTLLDVGCGTGGHAIALSQRGYDVTGVDLSEHMLEHARKKSLSLQTSRQPTWLCGDAKTFNAGKKFDVAIMMFAVVGYLTSNEEVIAGLRNIHRHLNPGSLFICDFWYGPSVLSVRPEDKIRVLELPHGQVIRFTNTTLNTALHTADVSFRLWDIEGDKIVSKITEKHRLRYYFPQEFSLLLKHSGFTMQSISAFPTLEDPLTEKTWNAFVVARAD